MKVTMLLLAVLLPSPLLAQGLGDTAAKERQKRAEKKATGPAKVFTDADLPKPEAEGEFDPASSGTPDEALSSRGTPSESGEEGSAVAEDASQTVDPLEKERQERKLLEAEWRVRFANAREQLAIAEANSWREVVRTEFYQGIPVPMKVKEQIETGELKQARQALADLEEQFRRTGLPPGWTREN
jgi:hypothetical protein